MFFSFNCAVQTKWLDSKCSSSSIGLWPCKEPSWRGGCGAWNTTIREGSKNSQLVQGYL